MIVSTRLNHGHGFPLITVFFTQLSDSAMLGISETKTTNGLRAPPELTIQLRTLAVLYLAYILTTVDTSGVLQ